jgi:hypothetical protein
MMKSKKTKYILLTCGVLLVIVMICLVLIAVSGIGISLIWPFSKSATSTTTASIGTETGVPTTETAVTGEETEVPTAESNFPPELMNSVSQIESQVSQLRTLTATDPFNRELISETDLEQIVKDDFFADYSDEDARRDVIELSTLGLLPAGFDLKQFYTELYSEQIAGFYDDEIKTMYVVQGVGFGGSEKLTYAHEFTHVLQDQVYGFDDRLDMSEESCQTDSERCAAIQALVEGDAVLTETLWFQSYATQQDYEDLMEAYDNYESPILDSAPPYMSADLYFPYEQGLIFVQLLYNNGGYVGVDQAYENLPVSTEQIMHPDRYPADTPITITLPDLTDLLGPGWMLYDQNVMGEWYTFLILNKSFDESWQLSDSFASTAAEGWGGDAYAFYLNEDTDQVVFVMDSVWDNQTEANEFTSAFTSYADLRWQVASEDIGGYPTWVGPDGMIVFLQDGNRTLWLITPDVSAAETILNILQ